MPFFGKGKVTNKAAPQRRSILGMLFNPEIGRSLRPLSENGTAFAYLLAFVFASNGLFPKNHPALMGVEGAKLNLTEIFRTAWNDLSFTKEGLPKIILFFAVTGTLIFSALAVITLLLFMAVGHAHADTTSFFTPPDTTNDLAQGWLNFLFNNQPLPSSIDTNNTILTQYTGFQQALITALAFYSNAILILAAVILFYHLIAMVVETAHHGVAMGKRANQIWAPIRLVFAIGLLVPVGTGGLNSGQYIVIQMAQWGSGLASQVWDQFITATVQKAYTPPPPADVQKFAGTIVSIAACVQVLNAINSTVTSSGVTMPGNSIGPQTMPGLQPGQTGSSYEAKTPSPQEVNICGTVVFPAPSTNTKGALASAGPAIVNAYNTAYTQAYNKATTELTGYFNASPPNFLYNGENPSSWTDVTDDVATAFQDSLNSSLTSILGALAQNSNDTSTEKGLGWVAAGAYFNQIAFSQGALEQALRDGIPKLTPPNLTQIQEEDTAKSQQISPKYQMAIDALNQFTKWVSSPPPNSQTSMTPPTNSNSCDDSFISAVGHELEAFLKTANTAISTRTLENAQNTSIVDILMQFADYVAAMNCVWHPAAASVNGSTPPLTIGFQLNGYDVFAELSRLGYANLNTSFDLLNDVVFIDVAGGLSSGVGGRMAGSNNGLVQAIGGTLQLVGGAATGAGWFTRLSRHHLLCLRFHTGLFSAAHTFHQILF